MSPPALHHDTAPPGHLLMGAGVELDTGQLPGLHLQHRRGPGPGAAPGAHCAHIEASVSRVGSIYLDVLIFQLLSGENLKLGQI